jgi:hypothetical protein
MGIDQESIRLRIYCPNFIIKTVETVSTLYSFGRLDEFVEKEGRIGDSVRYYLAYMDRDEDEIKWRAARRWKTKFENAQAGIYREFNVSGLQLRGWDAHRRVNRVLTSQEASKLVLTGEGRRGSAVMEIEDEEAV